MNENVNFVPKKINPPNEPQARPIGNLNPFKGPFKSLRGRLGGLNGEAIDLPH